jgi:PAS domain S-box
VVEDQTDLICRYLVDGTLTFVNRALCDYYRLPREELIGHPYFPLMPPEEQDRSRRHLASLTRENPVGSIDHFNLMLDGDIHWTSWTDRALFDDQGQFIEYQSVGRDISEAKQRQREMEIGRVSCRERV